jgi:hypothetical protein
MKIKIDLKNLPKDPPPLELGACLYSAPCIIGSLMTEEERQLLKQRSLDGTGVEFLVDSLLDLPVDQYELATRLQSSFDNDEPEAYANTYRAVYEKVHAND